ncbi:MAG: hypothetical protein PHG40_00605 [Candidatus Omnitrophica bacterium]|nr:hypothetical protein [Candidatus Omnitrophota bacterium]
MKKTFMRGQSIAEYFIVMSVVLAAILALGFVGRMRNTFGEYFTDAASVMTKETEP